MNSKPTLERTLTPLLGWLALAVTLTGVALTFLAPPDVNQGYLTRILPPHVTSAWVAYLGFFMTSIYSLAYLLTRQAKFDRLAASSAELGVVLIAFALISGSLWGRVTWGTFWEWGDARIVTTLLMMMVYLGYLMVRGLIEDQARRARVAAALGTVAAVAVPINYMSVYWWRTLHQTPTFSLPQQKSYLSGNPQLALTACEDSWSGMSEVPDNLKLTEPSAKKSGGALSFARWVTNRVDVALNVVMNEIVTPGNVPSVGSN